MIERLNRLLDRGLWLVSWLCFVALLVVFGGQILVVALRYVMGVGFLELQDLVTYAFSALVVLAIPLAMRADRHVRVDILRDRMAPALKRGIDRIGALVLILPVFGILLLDVWPLTFSAWAILEGSRETGGLPGLFLVKTAVPVMCVLVLALGLRTILRPGQVGEDDD